MAGAVRIRQVKSRSNLSFGLTLRLSSDRHDLIPPPLTASWYDKGTSFTKLKGHSLHFLKS